MLINFYKSFNEVNSKNQHVCVSEISFGQQMHKNKKKA